MPPGYFVGARRTVASGLYFGCDVIMGKINCEHSWQNMFRSYKGAEGKHYQYQICAKCGERRAIPVDNSFQWGYLSLFIQIENGQTLSRNERITLQQWEAINKIVDITTLITEIRGNHGI
jgi:hypothetical protein